MNDIRDLLPNRMRERTFQLKAKRDAGAVWHEPQFVECKQCGRRAARTLWARSLYVCPNCGYHMPIGGYYRLSLVLDHGSFRKMEEHSYVETVCYILMGLSVLVVFKQLFALSPTACYWIIAEGVCYITGAAFYSLRKARYMHSVFHFFVLGGSACHMVAVWDILVKML